MLFTKVPKCHRGIASQKVIIPKDAILMLYNRNFETEGEDVVTEFNRKVHHWIMNRAKEMDWPNAIMAAGIGLILTSGIPASPTAGQVIHPQMVNSSSKFPTVSMTSSTRPVVAISKSALLDMYNDYFDTGGDAYKREVDLDVQQWAERRAGELRWPTHMFTDVAGMAMLLSRLERVANWQNTIEVDGYNIIEIDNVTYAISPTIV